jgi:hypothetical protein
MTLPSGMVDALEPQRLWLLVELRRRGSNPVTRPQQETDRSPFRCLTRW